MTLPALSKVSLPKVSLPKGPRAVGFAALTLGTSPIGLTINNRSYAATLAEMRGYCKEAACDFYAQLNPYKSYGKDWDEIGRQSYTLGDIGAWSTSSGTIEVPRTAFGIYGRHNGWLACTVAHEISHIQRNHVFQASYYANNTIRSVPDKKKEERSYVKSRQQELESDRDSAVMMARAGYDERIKELAAFYAKLEKEPPAKSSATAGHFTYSPADNLLSFVPSKP